MHAMISELTKILKKNKIISEFSHNCRAEMHATISELVTTRSVVSRDGS